MGYRNLVDCHIHSDNSNDAHHSVTLICEKAVGKGLRAISITDHCECLKYQEKQYATTCRQSNFEVLKARTVFEGQLVISSGVEIGNPTRDLLAANDVLKNKFDFVVASVHRIKGKKKSFKELDYAREGNKPELLMPRYFDDIIETVDWNGFDALAHLTYPLRYFPEHLIADYDIFSERERIEYILKALAKNGKALEINTLTKEYKAAAITSDMHPCFEIVKLFKELGGEYITVGSDAHTADMVGNKIVEAYDMALEAGFKYVTIYEKREPISIKIQ